jgi:hypothetical protein
MLYLTQSEKECAAEAEFKELHVQHKMKDALDMNKMIQEIIKYELGIE